MKGLKTYPSFGRNVHGNYVNIRYRNIIRHTFIKAYINDSKTILKNLKKISKKYNLSYFSIFLNAFVKYPLLGFAPTEFFMYRLYTNSHKDYLTFLNLIKMIKANKWKFWLVGNKFRFKMHVKNKLPISNLVAVYNHETGKITQYAKPKNSKVVIKPCRGG